MTRHPLHCLLPGLLLLIGSAFAAPLALDEELAAIQTEWARANYAIDEAAARSAALETLAARCADFSARHPDRAEPLVWEGIVLSTWAGAKGGLGALGLAKKSRERLLAALAIDERALDGSAHTSLGTLYHKVPGWPLGFGSDDKARTHLEAALAINPAGIDPNYFYAEYLHDEGNHAAALEHLQTALRAAPRPGRASADEGRRGEIRVLMAKVRRAMR